MADKYISQITPLGSSTTYLLKDKKAIESIARDGTTFTATRRDGTTFTFTQQDNNTIYTFASGTNGSFSVTPSDGSAQTISVGKPATAGTADVANSVAWGNITGKPSSFTPSSHTHYELATQGDNRNVATTPNDYVNRLVFRGLKSNSYFDSPSSDTYSYIVGLRGWCDSSGGHAHELAFNNTGIYWRSGATTSWGSWYRIYTTGNKPTKSDIGLGNVTNDAQIPKSIGTTKGDIIYWSAASTPIRLGIGSAGQVLKVSSDGIPAWSNDNNSITGVKGDAESSYRTGNVNLTPANILNTGTTAQFWRGDNGWSNTIKQTANAALGIDTNLKIGTARKDLNFDIANGSGTGINNGYAGGITWGSGTSAYAGIYYQTSSSYGSRLHFATTSSYANGAYTRMLITHDGKIGIGTLTPSTALHVIGDITASGLTASQAVSTDANKKLVSSNLTTESPSTSGSGIEYIATVSQNAVGKITATKSTVRDASASQSGVVSTGAQTFAGNKTFNGIIDINNTTRINREEHPSDAFSTSVGITPLNIFGLKNGYPVYTDPDFSTGVNSVGVYNNTSGGNVVHTRQLYSAANVPHPGTSSGYVITIQTKGVASPGVGGFVQSISSRENAVFVQIFRALVPEGRKVNIASNSMGTSYTDKWLTSQEGTGKWEWYARIVHCGATGTFSNGGHIYLDGAAGTASAPVTWHLAFCNLYDITKGQYDGLRVREADNADTATKAAALSPVGTTAEFWRGDNTWSNELSGGQLKITNYSNTVTIGSGNANYTHFSSSADIPFYFNKSIWVDGDLYPYGTSNTRSLGSSSKRWKSLLIGTADSYGGTTKPIYWKNGVPTELSETVGATDKPVFLSSGTITASTSTIGSGIIPIYMSSGQIKASTSTVGSLEKPVYLNAGTVTALNPVWLLTGGTATVDNEDLNAEKYKAIGNYYSNGDAKSKTILHTPFGAAASTDCLSFTLKTEASLGAGTTYLRQLWRSYNSGVEAERTSGNSGSSWSTWRTKVFKNSDATTTQGNGEQPIYIAANGQAVNTTYHLKAHVEDGSANHLAYYSAARTIDYTPNITFINGLAADVGTGKIYGLEISGAITGTAANLKAGEVGILQYGDAGPQLRFDSSGQKGAIIFTEYDNMSDSGGASFHFVTNQYSQGAAIRAKYLTAGDNQTAGRIRIYQAGAYGDISANDKSSYGALKLTQAKGSYVGLLIGNSSDSLTIMDSGTSKGLYAQGTIGWLIYGHNTNKTVGIRTSSITSGYDIELGGTTHTSKLIHIDINSGTSLDNSRPLMIGPLTGANLAIGRNAIQARNNGEESILYLNYNAGSIQFGSSTSLTTPTKIFGTVTPGADATYDLGTTNTLRWKNGFFTTSLRVGPKNTTTGSATDNNSYIGPDGFYVNSIAANDSGYYLRNKGKNYATLLVRVPGVANTTGAARLTLGNSTANTAADNARGEIVLYSHNASTYAYMIASNVTTSVTLEATADRFEMPKLRITSAADIGGKTSSSPPLSIGTLTSTHIEIDTNEILAKNSDTTTGTLYLQDEDGLTSVAGSKGLLVKTTSQAWKESHDAEYRGGIKISDATNSNGAWNWIKQVNTNAKRWFGMGTVAHAWYLVTSASTRTDAGYDRGILYYGNTGKIFVNKSYLDIHSDQGNYREGIRIYPNSNWSTIVLGGADLTEETGTSANSWSLHNYNGVFYLTKNGSSSQVNGGLSHSGSTWTMIGSTSTTANTAAWSILALGNANNITTTNAHSQGALRLYSDGTKYVDIKNQNTTNNRSIWLQDYDSDQYLIHGGSDAKIGDTNLPVYIAANGRATKISYTLSANISAGTANQLAYYSAAETISGTPNITRGTYNISIAGNSSNAAQYIASNGTNQISLHQAAGGNRGIYQNAGDVAGGWLLYWPDGSKEAHIVQSNLIIDSGNLYAGVTSSTTERQVHARAAAGDIYLYSQGSATASRGIWLSAHGTGPARNVFNVNTNNITTYYGGQLMYRSLPNKTTHALALKNEFDNHKADIPRAQQISYYSSAMSNGSIAMGYFLSGYDDTPYGGFFVAHYNTPRYVGINSGTYTQWRLLKGADSGAIGGTSTPIYIDSDGIAQPCTAYGSATAATANAVKTTLMTNASTAIYVLGATGTKADTSATVYKGYRTSTVKVYFRGDTGVLMGAAWNDYAEYRQAKDDIEIKPGRVVKEVGDETLELTTERLQRGCSIVSNTFGISIGESETNKLPLAVSGRVLAYPYENKEEFKNHIGWPVCSGPNGTVSIMTEEEEMKYPSRIIGTISAVPDYDIWHGGADVIVDGRVWIKVR